MTVDDLRYYLDRFPGSATIVFTPERLCGGGMPQWLDCHVKHETSGYEIVNDEEVEKPTGRVCITLQNEEDI